MADLWWALGLCARTVWAFLPAMAANQAPVFARSIPALDRPVDGGRTWRDGRRLFGAHKTWRGVAAGVAAGALTALAQAAVPMPAGYALAPSVRPLALGSALGLGALSGDLAKSFLKRRRGVADGEPWFPADQLDAAVGALAAARLLGPVPWEVAACLLLLAAPLHLAMNRVGFILGLREADR
jgi:CDP-2,3-bis-(O-geranylgeranyl)-sn-glycerol synthase